MAGDEKGRYIITPTSSPHPLTPTEATQLTDPAENIFASLVPALAELSYGVWHEPATIHTQPVKLPDGTTKEVTVPDFAICPFETTPVNHPEAAIWVDVTTLTSAQLEASEKKQGQTAVMQAAGLGLIHIPYHRLKAEITHSPDLELTAISLLGLIKD